MLDEQEVIDSHALIIDTFKSFRQELLDSYGNIKHYNKADSSPVTNLDIKIETVLKDKLVENFPNFGFEGEETKKVIGPNRATWYVDPIDSTNSFIHGLPYCSNMAGLVINNKIVASIVYNFISDELFTAFKGKGAYMNGKKIFVENTNLSDACVFADSYSYKNLYQFYASSKVQFYAPLSATGFFLTCLAKGNIQGVCYSKANIKNHDTIPGILIALEAGSEMISLNDDPLNYKCLQFIIGTKNICDIAQQHLDKIKKCVNF